MAAAEKGYFDGILKFMKIMRDRKTATSACHVSIFMLRPIKIKIHDAVR